MRDKLHDIYSTLSLQQNKMRIYSPYPLTPSCMHYSTAFGCFSRYSPSSPWGVFVMMLMMLCEGGAYLSTNTATTPTRISISITYLYGNLAELKEKEFRYQISRGGVDYYIF